MIKFIDQPCPPPPEIQNQIDEHQRWLESGGKEGRRLGSGDEVIEFNGLTLDSVDLSLSELACAEFKGSSLRGAWLIGAHLSGAAFNNSDLTGAHLERADLTYANFINAEISQVSFEEANTKEVIWTESDDKAFRQKNRSRLDEISEMRSNWTESDWDAYSKKCDEDAIISRKRDAMRTEESFKIWRSKRNTLLAPQLRLV